MAATPAQAMGKERVHILGVGVDRVDMTSTLRTLEGFIAEGKPRLIITADASGIVQAQEDPVFRELFDVADLITPDSEGILWAAKRAGKPLRERVSGVELVDHMCALSAERGYRIYFLGAAPGVAEEAAERQRLKYPGCCIVGARHGYFSVDEDEAVAQEVAQTKPDALFVAMGIPRQEKFIRSTAHIIAAPVAMGVGGTFDVMSGRTKRAPKFVQKMRLEWLWRLLLNPKKISKAKLLPRFVWLVLKEGRRKG